MNKQYIITILVVLLIAGTIIFYKTRTVGDSPAPTTQIEKKDSKVAQTPQENTTVNSAVSKAIVSPVSQNKESVKSTYDYIVTLTNKGYNPEKIEIRAGQTVRFLNNSNFAMRIASNPYPTQDIYSEMNQNITVGKGGFYDFMFLKVGAWGYHNHTSPTQSGVVIVHLQ